MRATTILLIVLLATTINLIKGQTSNQWTLDTCVNYALEHNLNLMKQDLTVSMLKNNYEIAKFDRLPGVNANANAGTYFGQSFNYNELKYVNKQVTYFSGDVAANVNLFDGFRTQHKIRRSKAQMKASHASMEIEANNLAIEIVNYYLQILYNGEQLNAAENQLKVTRKQIERTRELVNAGTLPRGDVLELKAQAADEKSQIINYKNNKREAKINLKQAMNLADDSISVTKPEVIEPEKLYAGLPVIDSIYQIAIRHLPEIKAAEADMRAKKEAIDIAKANYYPSLNLGASLSSRYDELATDPKHPEATYKFIDQIADYSQANIGLSLSIPIFNKFQTKYNIENAKIEYQQAKYDKNITLQNIYKRIESARNDARAAYQSYKAAQESLAASKESFKYAEQRYNSGLINSVDYNLAKTKLSNARVSLVNARYDLIFKVKILDFYMGRELKL